MSNDDLVRSHLWEGNPRQFKQDGKTILLRQCGRCGRDFALGLTGSDWCAIYLGALKVEPLAKSANERWLNEKCPGIRLPSDYADRGILRRG
jgi:hypothetical protein